jgi:hypothetical protein
LDLALELFGEKNHESVTDLIDAMYIDRATTEEEMKRHNYTFNVLLTFLGVIITTTGAYILQMWINAIGLLLVVLGVYIIYRNVYTIVTEVLKETE